MQPTRYQRVQAQPVRHGLSAAAILTLPVGLCEIQNEVVATMLDQQLMADLVRVENLGDAQTNSVVNVDTTLNLADVPQQEHSLGKRVPAAANIPLAHGISE